MPRRSSSGTTSPGSRSVNDLGGGVEVRATKTDFSPGMLKRTGIPTDMAVGGDGFFMVRRPDGDYLTRAGNFMFTQAGRLVTQDNYPVLSDTGSPIEIDPEQPDWQLSSTGAIVQEGNPQNLALVQPQSLGDLAKAGENLFKPLAPTQPVADEQRNVKGGLPRAIRRETSRRNDGTHRGLAGLRGQHQHDQEPRRDGDGAHGAGVDVAELIDGRPQAAERTSIRRTFSLASDP